MSLPRSVTLWPKAILCFSSFFGISNPLRRRCRGNQHLSVSHHHLQSWLRIHRRSVDHRTVPQTEARPVPWTTHAIAFDFSFRERATHVRAFICHSEYPTAPFQQQNAGSVHARFLRLAFFELALVQDGRKFFRQLFIGIRAMVDSNTLVIRERSAQPRARKHNSIACECKSAAQRTFIQLAGAIRNSIERRGGHVQQAVHCAYALRFPLCIAPICKPCDRRESCSRQAHRDRGVCSGAVFIVASRFQPVEDGRCCPASNGNIGNRRMHRVPKPYTMQSVLYGLPGWSHRGECIFDQRLTRLLDGSKPVLLFYKGQNRIFAHTV